MQQPARRCASGESPRIQRGREAAADGRASPSPPAVVRRCLGTPGERLSQGLCGGLPNRPSGRNATELLRLISRAIDRDAAACATLTARVASLISYLPSPRGRPLSVATATHEFLLDELHYRGKPRLDCGRAQLLGQRSPKDCGFPILSLEHVVSESQRTGAIQAAISRVTLSG